MGRAVRIKSQLKSHQRFASAFPRYCQLVDNARLYCTNDLGGPATVNNHFVVLFVISSINLLRCRTKEHLKIMIHMNSVFR